MTIPKEILDFWRNLKPRANPNAEAHARFMNRVAAMTPRDVFLSSVAAGIHNLDGSLRPPYNGED
jgi:hypothetical protein